ncbi:MAG: glycosyltransferase family 39 protein [Mycobacteriales bacterium]
MTAESASSAAEPAWALATTEAPVRHRHTADDLAVVRPPARRRVTLWGLAMAVAVAGGVLLRFWATSDLWLDEAQSVVVARLPLHELPAALRQDGAPPLYYLLLHGWTSAFGTSDVAVRSLSGVLSVFSLPLIWSMGRRLGGRRVGAVSLLLLASSPFAVRYATETRMYSLVILLTLLGFHALAWNDRRPGWPPTLATGLVTAALLYTHYWAIWLVTVVGGGLLWRSLRGPARTSGRWALAGLAAGALAFLPWTPILVFQLRHTGTPWADPASLAGVVHSVGLWAGGSTAFGRLQGLLFFALLLLGIFGRPQGPAGILLDLHGRPVGRRLAAASVGTMAVALTAALVTHSSYSVRYTAVAFAPFLVLLALGADTFADVRLRRGIVGAVVALGFVAAVPLVTQTRTQAGEVAAVLSERAAPGDVVVYCPDQLGPAVSRLAPPGLDQLVYPTGGPPQRVDWVDYSDRNEASVPADFVRQVEQRGRGHGIWLVYTKGYHTLQDKCRAVRASLARTRPMTTDVTARPRVFEREQLLYFPPP